MTRREKSDVTENFTFLRFCVYLILDLRLFIFLGQDFYRSGENARHFYQIFIEHAPSILTTRQSLERCLKTPDPECLGLLYF